MSLLYENREENNLRKSVLYGRGCTKSYCSHTGCSGTPSGLSLFGFLFLIEVAFSRIFGDRETEDFEHEVEETAFVTAFLDRLDVGTDILHTADSGLAVCYFDTVFVVDEANLVAFFDEGGIFVEQGVLAFVQFAFFFAFDAQFFDATEYPECFLIFFHMGKGYVCRFFFFILFYVFEIIHVR